MNNINVCLTSLYMLDNITRIVLPEYYDTIINSYICENMGEFDRRVDNFIDEMKKNGSYNPEYLYVLTDAFIKHIKHKYKNYFSFSGQTLRFFTNSFGEKRVYFTLNIKNKDGKYKFVNCAWIGTNDYIIKNILYSLYESMNRKYNEDMLITKEQIDDIFNLMSMFTRLIGNFIYRNHLFSSVFGRRKSSSSSHIFYKMPASNSVLECNYSDFYSSYYVNMKISYDFSVNQYIEMLYELLCFIDIFYQICELSKSVKISTKSDATVYDLLFIPLEKASDTREIKLYDDLVVHTC